jgi:hypothetical protein
MIPYIQKGEMAKLHSKRQAALCGCQPRCRYFYTFTEHEHDWILCARDAQQFAFEILEQLDLVTKKLAFPKSKVGWTTEQEHFIIRYFQDEHCFEENGKVKYGTYSLLGEMLGKTRDQVKLKIQHMSKEGKLVWQKKQPLAGPQKK